MNTSMDDAVSTVLGQDCPPDAINEVLLDRAIDIMDVYKSAGNRSDPFRPTVTDLMQYFD
jgi:hypothetical protein